MKSQGVSKTIVKAITTSLVAAAILFAVPAKSHAQVAVGVQFGQPAYGYQYGDGREAYREHEHWEHEQHERAEAYYRQQAWEQQQVYLRQQAWVRQQQYLQHEAWEHHRDWDRGYGNQGYDRGSGYRDGGRGHDDEHEGNRWR